MVERTGREFRSDMQQAFHSMLRLVNHMGRRFQYELLLVFAKDTSLVIE